MLSRLLMAGLTALPVGVWAGDGADRDMAVVARTCVTCHHPDNQAIPRLPGSLDREQLIARLLALRAVNAESTENTVMHRLLGAFDNDTLEALADTLTGSP